MILIEWMLVLGLSLLLSWNLLNTQSLAYLITKGLRIQVLMLGEIARMRALNTQADISCVNQGSQLQLVDESGQVFESVNLDYLQVDLNQDLTWNEYGMTAKSGTLKIRFKTREEIVSLGIGIGKLW